METKLEVSLKQETSLSQQMIQSLSILQMNRVELEEWLQNAAVENPVIEIDETAGREISSYDLDAARKLEWLRSGDYQNRQYYSEDFEETPLSDPASLEESLESILRSQLLHKRFDEQEQRAIAYIIYSLDENGYFTIDPEVAAKECSVDEAVFRKMLGEVKQLDPAGIGAQNLKECLMLQLYANPEHSLLAEQIINEYLEEVARNHITVIARKLKKACQK